MLAARAVLYLVALIQSDDNSMTAGATKTASNKALRAALQAWYGAHRRDLPWRRTRDPYAIWVSEIMLQQTRVAAVIDYYERFLRRFPTVESLAQAREEEVLALWSGLGYYRRARSLHAAAQKIAEEGSGVPRTSEGLRALPGIGRYTAAAIASIAFGEPLAVVDGNVERVLERLDGRSRSGEQVWQRAQDLLDPQHAGDWNQAMMELGATVCTPLAPACDACPLHRWCRLPGHDVRKPQAERKKKQSVHGLARRGKKVLLVQRGASERLMASMWELPSVEKEKAKSGEALLKARHSITDSDYEVTIVAAKFAKPPKGSRWFSPSELDELALTGVTRKALRRLKIL